MVSHSLLIAHNWCTRIVPTRSSRLFIHVWRLQRFAFVDTSPRHCCNPCCLAHPAPCPACLGRRYPCVLETFCLRCPLRTRVLQSRLSEDRQHAPLQNGGPFLNDGRRDWRGIPTDMLPLFPSVRLLWSFGVVWHVKRGELCGKGPEFLLESYSFLCHSNAIIPVISYFAASVTVCVVTLSFVCCCCW